MKQKYAIYLNYKKCIHSFILHNYLENKVYCNKIPHIIGYAKGTWDTYINVVYVTQVTQLPFPSFLRIYEALRVEWRSSTPHFASYSENMKLKKYSINYY